MNDTATPEPSEEHYVGITRDGVTVSYWRTARLWELAAALPVERVPLSSLSHLLGLEDTQSFTNRELALKVRRIMEADLDYPIIFSEHGWLWDGWHRLMKAFVLGMSEISVVRFLQDPEPDYHKRLEAPASPPAV